MKKLFILIIFFGSLVSFSQNEKTSLKVFTFSEVEELHQKKPKPVIVFIYTNWCKYCHGMEKTTFKNKKVIQLLNENFYFIKLNGEEKNDITFLGKIFVYKPTGTNTGIHELANELASKKGRISYPTTVFLNLKLEIDLQLNGFNKAKDIIKLLSKFQ
ncbi:MAG: thioredoxin fold domain-containing protein [Polaribacter sp.]|uniref:thioredoxin family protein n=1 Tax=Polaribacter sp. TaxID=1920175 RepID=UPI002F35EF91